MRQLTHGIYRETYLIPTDTKGKMIKFPIFNRKKTVQRMNPDKRFYIR